ncbi:unnamed protein product [Caenorhabditis angaria]|uniref:Uncharacterized protein n=1 Tax=Caenorhabditis angaria TaxID=860376 RepID=A0A9P1I8D3_9PELO|nr:unnamed protein product [Caenorhabditis angaria]
MINNVRSSLVYQLLIKAQETISCIYFLLIFLLYWYKGSILPYQNYVRVMEFLIIIPFVPIEYLRISWGSRGNILESSAFLLLSSFLAVPVILITVYLTFFQNYVLFIEEIFSYIFGGFVIFETILSFSLSIAFSSSSSTTNLQ